MNNEMTTEYMSNEEVIEVLKGIVFGGFDRTTRKERQALDVAIKALENERPQGECISREAINLEIEKRYCSKHCVLPSEEPYCPDNCPARFLKNIVKECPTVPQVVVFAENTDEKAIEDMKAELQNVIDSERPQGEWKHIGGDEWVCSECGHVITTEGSWENPLSIGAYHCENCGAEMRLEEPNVHSES